MATLLESLHGSRGFAVCRYHDDYDAIRVKSVPGGSQFSFVNTQQTVYDLGDTLRMRPFLRMNLLVGEVDYVSEKTLCELGDTAQKMVCIRLRPPSGATCEVLRLYAEQMNRMRDILVSDARDTVGCTAISWFDAAAISQEWIGKSDCFYVLVPAGVEARTSRGSALEPGTKLVLTATMERVEMDTIRGVDRPRVAARSRKKGQDTCATARQVSVGGDRNIAFSLPSSFMSALIDTLKLPGKLGFIGAQYHRDYEAIRVKDLIGGSLFCFVETEERVYRLGDERRQRPSMRMDLLVGEVDCVFDATSCTFGGEAAREMICIRVRAPTKATCEVQHIYAEQVKRLEEILADDGVNTTNTTSVSWFDMSAVSHSWAKSAGCFYLITSNTVKSRSKRFLALKPGTMIAMIASPERVDMDIEGGVDSRYYLLLNNIRVADRFDVPQKGPGYVCDRNGSTGCEHWVDEGYILKLQQTIRRPDFFAQTSNGHLSAYLFATGVSEAVKVRVPVTSTTPPTQPSDVNFMIWMATDPNHARTNLCYLEMDVGDEVGFMVFVPDQERPMGRADLLHPVNASLAAQQQPALPQFRGNILVMRRDRRSSAFLDVRQEDLVLAMQCAIGESSMNAREK
ncbi:hypothetical protein C8R47DRAFT_1080534 [Mycena vitilis]|nr:hypothetical protein C8R47DRAFT_1080534 [Mycena vitilis]